MDLDEWELLPDDGFLEIQDDGGKKIFSRKYGGGTDPNSNFFNMNYFICPSPNSQKIPSPPDQKPRPTNQLVPVPIKLEQFISHKALDHELVKEFTKVEAPNLGGAVETDDHQNTVSQVFFNKTKENEFVDMKMDSPRSSGRGILAQVFEDRSEAYKGEAMEGKIGSKVKNDQKDSLEKSDSKEEEEEEEEKNDGLNIWKWSLNGIGAICSFGVAAATICIVIFGSQHRNKQQNQKPRFQIYTDEKERIKQVGQHATKFNEAILAVRGVPLTRAHFTFGGHYDGL